MLSYAALTLAILLLSSIPVYYADAQVNLGASGVRTKLTLDDVRSNVRIGDTVTFTGMLTTMDGEPIDQGLVKVYMLTAEPKLILLNTDITSEGRYEVQWEVQMLEKTRVDTDVITKIPSQAVTVFAQFDGDETYASSKSGKAIISIKPNTVKVFVNTDKKAYRAGETALIFINFIDEDDNFVDPDSIKADFTYVNSTATSMSFITSPHVPIGNDLEKKTEGSYTYLTLKLKAGHNQISVIPFKAGYNIEPATITITVLM